MTRPTLDEYGLMLAQVASARSEDPKHKVGACILDDYGLVVGQGYNGPPAGIDLRPDEWADRDKARAYTVHAEANAMRVVRPFPDGCTLYTTMAPCAECVKQAASLGIWTIVYATEASTRWADAIPVATRLGVTLRLIPLVIPDEPRTTRAVSSAHQWGYIDDYQEETRRTAGGYGEQFAHFDKDELIEMLHTTILAVGLAGEVGELLEIIKKTYGHGRALDESAILKEFGDVQWYTNALADRFGLSMSDALEENVRKLRARYPGGFVPEGERDMTTHDKE